MARKMEYGDWAQIVGSFNVETRRGEILSMLPGEGRVRVD